ncbi:glycosyltransferase family 4 protein [Thermococcus paralvinellae]|uniref:Glycosyl transferase family protein 15 n=1 Tax=Thermococcus paralvinellae TaxID=582419 RepID=W0IAA0_9EURY|nr:glycosyltransferase family 4 protein [Thermococcus paralvinellae]AHF81410.1 glycosyl transferase family protein 15 [Thermococcus paralvinellae]
MKSAVLIVSPHTKVRLKTTPTEGVESRISYLARIFVKNSREFLIIEPSDLKDHEKNHNRVYFYAFDFIKIKNMRLGSYFLSLNPFYHYALFKSLKKYRPSVILISQPWGVFSTYLIVKKIFRLNSRIIQDSHNVESEYAKIIIKDSNIPKVIKLFYLITIGFIEKLSLSYVDCIIAISHKNKKTFIEKYRAIPEKIIVIPPMIRVKDSLEGHGKLKKDKHQVWAVFHGIYRTLQNREAINIIKNKLAREFKKYKNFQFIIFGKGVPKMKNDALISLGFVKNVHSVLRECDIAVVPLISGEGVKLKVLDYMAVGLPIVTTKKGAEGLELVNNKHAIVVHEVNGEFVRAIKYLIENPKIRKKLGHNARKLAEKKYRLNKFMGLNHLLG